MKKGNRRDRILTNAVLLLAMFGALWLFCLLASGILKLFGVG